MVNLMNRSEQLASLRDIFFSELVCMPENTFWIDELVAIGAEIVREFHFDAVTVDDLKHQAFMALGEYTDTYNNHWDGFEHSGEPDCIDDAFDMQAYAVQQLSEGWA